MKYDVVVVGGGLMGSAVAYHLARNNTAVLVVDRGDLGNATAAGAGILSAQTSGRSNDAWFNVAVKAGEYYPILNKMLREDGQDNTGYKTTGLLVTSTDEREREAFLAMRETIFSRLERFGGAKQQGVRDISPEEARSLLPVLGEVSGALYHEDAAQVDGRLLRNALRQGAILHGAKYIDASVDSINVENGKATGVQVAGEFFAAEAVVLAAGAWSRSFGDALRFDIPVAPQRGQIVHLTVPDTPTGNWAILVNMAHYYYVPWADNRIVFGATRETGSGFKPFTSVEGIREVMNEIMRVTPGLAEASIGEIRVGLRPLSDDLLPLLGPAPAVPNAYFATGHGAGGLQLGPYSAKLLADMILGRALETDITPYSPARFT